ncbi:hypothetical protein VaNZ11_002255 [Volvox africanus]|uniref:Ferredoxin n=1 Tax=Volvox africanus TaxID=51714 RepID=A0ABQ5RS93_9CHLO|nr:hypothetical protein VaNZ11_002255 [Volvox africanus]
MPPSAAVRMQDGVQNAFLAYRSFLFCVRVSSPSQNKPSLCWLSQIFLVVTTFLSFFTTGKKMCSRAITSSCNIRMSRSAAFGSQHPLRSTRILPRAARTTYKIEIEHDGKKIELAVPEGESILSVALDKGIDLPHDCKLGVCMTCPAKLVSGKVDQSGSMLSDDVAEKGYTLLCVATPKSDCKILTISEDELLDLQLVAGA